MTDLSTRPTMRVTPAVLRLRTQMRAADYNPDQPHHVDALACVLGITTAQLAAVLTGRSPLDWRIPRRQLTKTLGINGTPSQSDVCPMCERWSCTCTPWPGKATAVALTGGQR